MSRMLALIDGSPSSPAVLRSATSLATIADIEVDPIHVYRPDDPESSHRPLGARAIMGDPITALLAELRADDVVGAVLGARATRAKPVGSVALAVIAGSPVPLVVLPPHSGGLTADQLRLLVPLDGERSTSDALVPLISALFAAGAEVRIVHFFDSATIPPFIETAEDLGVLAKEFALTHLPVEASSCDLRLGHPAQHIFDVVADHPTDAIVLAWAQDLRPGRAEVILRLLRESPVPLIIVPLAGLAADAATTGATTV